MIDIAKAIKSYKFEFLNIDPVCPEHTIANCLSKLSSSRTLDELMKRKVEFKITYATMDISKFMLNSLCNFSLKREGVTII